MDGQAVTKAASGGPDMLDTVEMDEAAYTAYSRSTDWGHMRLKRKARYRGAGNHVHTKR